MQEVENKNKATQMLQTVKNNIEGYTDRDVARARRAQKLYHIIDAPDMRLMK